MTSRAAIAITITALVTLVGLIALYLSRQEYNLSKMIREAPSGEILFLKLIPASSSQNSTGHYETINLSHSEYATLRKQIIGATIDIDLANYHIPLACSKLVIHDCGTTITIHAIGAESRSEKLKNIIGIECENTPIAYYRLPTPIEWNNVGKSN